jgi:hypothetical protein
VEVTKSSSLLRDDPSSCGKKFRPDSQHFYAYIQILDRSGSPSLKSGICLDRGCGLKPCKRSSVRSNHGIKRGGVDDQLLNWHFIRIQGLSPAHVNHATRIPRQNFSVIGPPSKNRREPVSVPKICRGRKLTVPFSGIKICVSFAMPIHPYPQLVLIKSNSYPLFSFILYL